MRVKKYTVEECRRKADQEWEMAGLARCDRDYHDEQIHNLKARAWEEEARRLQMNRGES